MAVLTNEYQYIGRSEAIPDQNNQHRYYLLLYAKTSEDITTGHHTVTVKQRLVSSSSNRFYGYSTNGSITIDGTIVQEWSYQNIPGAEWIDGELTEDGVTYNVWVDLMEGVLDIDVGYGTTQDIVVAASWTFVSSSSAGYLPQRKVTAEVSQTVTLPIIAGVIYIDDGSGWNAYQLYVDNGKSWDQVIPYVDNGKSWDICA